MTGSLPIILKTKYLLCGDKRTHLNRELDPVPTIYIVGYVPNSLLLPSSLSSSRKPTSDRTEPDQFPFYHREYKTCDLDALNEKYDDHAIYFLVQFSSGIPQITQSIIVDVKLFYIDSPIPLWSGQGQSNNFARNAK